MTIQEQNSIRLSKILSLFNELKSNELYQTINLDEENTKILKLCNEIDEEKFKLAFIGEFSTGKSSIINTLIQKNILPAKHKPTTNQITIIKDSNDEYVRIENKPNTTRELTKENVMELNEFSKENLEIGVNLPHLSHYELYDTPGVNDPSMLSDDIVFNLVEQVDIVFFTIHATQALKQSEINFLTKLVRKKDISKFFFIINQIDLVGEEKYNIKNDFLEKLSKLLKISQDILSDRTFLYSAKNCLETIKDSDNDTLVKCGYENLVATTNHYIKTHKQELYDDILKRKIQLIFNFAFIKIDTLLDKIDGKDKEYDSTLQVIESEVNAFRLEIEDAIYDFNKEFDIQKDDLKRSIETDLNTVAEKIIGEINSRTLKDLSKDRYIEIRTKKLVEDVIEDDLQKFIKKLRLNLEKFDKNIEPVFNQKSVVINELTSKNNASTLVKGFAIAGVATGAVIYAPTVLGMAVTGIGISAVANGLGGLIPGIGGAIGGAVSGAISSAGIMITQLGKVAFDLGKWGVDGIAKVANEAENMLKIKQYQKYVLESLESIKDTILQNIDSEFKAESYIESYIQEKFPQKKELELKIETAKKEFNINTMDNNKNKKELIQIKEQLEGIL